MFSHENGEPPLHHTPIPCTSPSLHRLFPSDSHHVISTMAPRTPMHSSDLWREPQLDRLTPESATPFLSPRRASAEKHRGERGRGVSTERTLPMSPSKWMQSKVRRDGVGLHEGDILSLSLSKNDAQNEYAQALDPALFQSHRAGHLPLHNAPALPGLSKVLAAEMSHGYHGNDNRAFLSNTKLSDAAISALPGNHALLSPDTVDRESKSSFAAFSGPCNSTENDCKSSSDADASSSAYSPAPGEVAYNAFKLYSQMFPAAASSSAASRIGSSVSDPSAMVVRAGSGIHMHNEAHAQQRVLPHIRDLSDSRVDMNKRIKYTPIKEEKVFLDVKEEPYTEHFATPCNGTRACEASPNEQRTGLLFLSPTSESRDAARYSIRKDDMDESSTAIVSESRCIATDVNVIHDDLPKVFTSTSAQMSSKASLKVFSDELSIPLSLQPSTMMHDVKAVKTPVNGTSAASSTDWGKFLALSATPVGDNTLPPFQKRFTQLQAFLKQCDEADQNNCMQSIRLLSAEARSGYAVDLETRAIRLSLEEGKQMKRMKTINVLGKLRGEMDDMGATPLGPKLPAPGIITKSKNAP